jgi:hypothetical protein
MLLITYSLFKTYAVCLGCKDVQGKNVILSATILLFHSVNASGFSVYFLVPWFPVGFMHAYIRENLHLFSELHSQKLFMNLYITFT